MLPTHKTYFSTVGWKNLEEKHPSGDNQLELCASLVFYIKLHRISSIKYLRCLIFFKFNPQWNSEQKSLSNPLVWKTKSTVFPRFWGYSQAEEESVNTQHTHTPFQLLATPLEHVLPDKPGSHVPSPLLFLSLSPSTHNHNRDHWLPHPQTRPQRSP